MRWGRRFLDGRAALLAGMLCPIILGALLFFSRAGDALDRLSFDAPYLFAPSPPATDVIIVTMNEATYDDPLLNGTNRYPIFDRAAFGRFVDKLKADGAPLVVFDIFLKDAEPNGDALAAAITDHGNVILAAQVERSGEAEFPGSYTNEPASAFLGLPGCVIAHPEVLPDAGVVRTFPPEHEDHYLPSIPVAAAKAAGATVEAKRAGTRWVRYYGNAGALPTETFQTAMDRPAGYFKDKVVFIGGKPKIDYLNEKSDLVNTALTRWSRQPMRGVEVHATMFLNLVRGEWITRISSSTQLLMILGAGAVFGLAVTRFRPLPGALITILGALAVSVFAIVLFWTARVWMNWVLVAWVQLPVAWGAAALAHALKVERARQELEEEFETIKQNLPPASGESELRPSNPLAEVQPAEDQSDTITIPNYELLRMIGRGSYGQVWLAKTIIGGYRAVKIVFRTENYPFEREFEGVRIFGEISRMHPGWVTIYHVGKEDAAGFFYYVMEVADDYNLGRMIDHKRYTPKALNKILVDQGWLPVSESIDIGIKLADAVGALHRLGFVHRDIKPSNIIFVNDSPKIADIGLVARAGVHNSGGTIEFIPEEGMGNPRADIFSLGRVLYQMATGGDPGMHPALPPTVNKRKDVRELMQLMEIINTACAASEKDRYHSATDLKEELIHLQRRLQRRLK